MILHRNGYIKLLRPLLLFVLCLFFSSSSFAGQYAIKPYLETGIKQENNYFKSQTTKRKVNVYNVRPGIDFGYTTDKSSIMFDYNFDVIKYDDQDDVPVGAIKANSLDYTGHNGSLTAETQATDRLLIGLDDSLTRTREPDATDALSDSTDKSLYWTNAITPRMRYTFGEKLYTELKYTNLILDYKDDVNNEDSKEDRGTFVVGYNFNETTGFDLNYQIWEREYDKTSSDYQSNQLMLNVYKQFRVVLFSAGGGYNKRDFKQAAVKDLDSFTGQISMDGQLPKSRFHLGVNYGLNDSGAGNFYYKATRLEGSFGHLFFEKIDFNVSGYYQLSDYEGRDRKDDTWQVAGKLYYLFNDYIAFGAEAGYETRDSNDVNAISGLEDKNYDNYWGMLNLKLNYDFASR